MVNGHLCCPVCHCASCVYTPYIAKEKQCFRCGYEWPEWAIEAGELDRLAAAAQEDFDFDIVDDCCRCNEDRAFTPGLTMCKGCGEWNYAGLPA